MAEPEAEQPKKKARKPRTKKVQAEAEVEVATMIPAAQTDMIAFL